MYNPLQSSMLPTSLPWGERSQISWIFINRNWFRFHWANLPRISGPLAEISSALLVAQCGARDHTGGHICPTLDVKSKSNRVFAHEHVKVWRCWHLAPNSLLTVFANNCEVASNASFPPSCFRRFVLPQSVLSCSAGKGRYGLEMQGTAEIPILNLKCLTVMPLQWNNSSTFHAWRRNGMLLQAGRGEVIAKSADA